MSTIDNSGWLKRCRNRNYCKELEAKNKQLKIETERLKRRKLINEGVIDFLKRQSDKVDIAARNLLVRARMYRDNQIKLAVLNEYEDALRDAINPKFRQAVKGDK